MNLWLRGGKNNYELWEGHVHTATFNMDNQQRPIYSTWNSAQLFVAAWMKESLGEWDACLCMAASLCRSPQTTTMLVIGYVAAV